MVITVGRQYGSGGREIGTALAASVITSSENVCPRFLPQELGLEIGMPAQAGEAPARGE